MACSSTRRGDTLTLNAPIYTTGGLTISGGGTLSLPNANVTTGVTSASGIVAGTTFGNTVKVPITFSAPGGGGTTAQGFATSNAGGGIASITITNPGSGYVTAPTISFGGSGTGASATAVIGNDAASYTGGTFFNGGLNTNSGTLSLGGNNSIPGTSGTLTVNNGTLSTSAALLIPNAVTLSGNIVDLTLSGTGSFTFNGTVTGAAGTVATLTTNATTTINGAVTGGGTTLIKQGTGTLALSGTNTYTGNTIIVAGIVIAQNTAALGAGSEIVANGATLQFQQIAGVALAFARPLTVIGAGYTAGGTTGRHRNAGRRHRHQRHLRHRHADRRHDHRGGYRHN